MQNVESSKYGDIKQRCESTHQKWNYDEKSKNYLRFIPTRINVY